MDIEHIQNAKAARTDHADGGGGAALNGEADQC